MSVLFQFIRSFSSFSCSKRKSYNTLDFMIDTTPIPTFTNTQNYQETLKRVKDQETR